MWRIEIPASCGSSGSGVASNACRLSRTVRMVIAAALRAEDKKERWRSGTGAFLPLVFENIKTNGSSDRTNVGMPNLRCESNLRWIEWIGIYQSERMTDVFFSTCRSLTDNDDIDVKSGTSIGCVWWSDDGSSEKDIFLVRLRSSRRRRFGDITFGHFQLDAVLEGRISGHFSIRSIVSRCLQIRWPPLLWILS